MNLLYARKSFAFHVNEIKGSVIGYKKLAKEFSKTKKSFFSP
jgi:hypothetical protein